MHKRDSEHRSIIDSAGMSVAVLDESGTIVDVNAEWHDFAKSNGYADPRHGVGSSYFAICARAQAAPRNPLDSSSVNEAKQAVEDVLAGRRDSAKLSGVCHSPTEQRWVETTVDATDVCGRRGAVLRYLNVTGRVVTERELHRQSDLLKAIGSDLPVIVFQRFRNTGGWDYVYASDEVSRLFGCRDDELNGFPGDRMLDSIFADDRERVSHAYRAVVERGGGIWRSEFRVADGAGAIRWMRAMVRIRVEPDGSETDSLWVLQDVSQEMLANLRLQDAQERDPLTGLTSQAHFETLVDAALANCDDRASQFALVMLDIDGFREINEVHGRTVGDELLRKVSATLRGVVRKGEVVARLGADKFAVLCRAPASAAALALAGRLVSALHRTYQVEGQAVAVTVSAGVSVPQNAGTSANDLLHDAESAVKRARDAGGNQCLAYTAEMIRESSARMALRDALRDAIARADQFQLHYQPQVDIRSGRIIGCEALLRWTHPVEGMQSPAHFIPLAEQSGLIVPIGRWVMLEACRQYAAWRLAGLPPIPISVNVSVVQFARSDVLELISDALATTHTPPGAIDIEITETVLSDCSQQFVDELEAIGKLGVRIQLDDFGTGFSSLGYLRRMPLSCLKIDQSFARGAVANAKDAAIVRSIVDLASSLGFRTIAEGIETAEQLVFAREAGCDAMQGFYISPALPAADFARFLVDEAAFVKQQILGPPSAGFLQPSVKVRRQ